jgi:hypothetical protein
VRNTPIKSGIGGRAIAEICGIACVSLAHGGRPPVSPKLHDFFLRGCRVPLKAALGPAWARVAFIFTPRCPSLYRRTAAKSSGPQVFTDLEPFGPGCFQSGSFETLPRWISRPLLFFFD